MSLQKQTLDLSFSQGLDTKSDPFRVQAGKFLTLQNSIFDKIGRLTKRNGYKPLSSLSNSSSTFLTTFNGNLTAVGDILQAYSEPTNMWLNKGTFQPLNINTLPLIRSNLNQIQADTAIAPNGLVCTVFTDSPPSGPVYKYAIADSVTGQNVVAPIAIPVASGVVTGAPRVFLLNNYFIVLFVNVIATVNHLQYIAISTNNPTTVTANTDIASNVTPSSGLNYDGAVANNQLFIAYNTLAGGQSIKMTYLSSTLGLANTVTFAGHKATLMSVTADTTNPSAPIIYASFYESTTPSGWVLAVDQSLGTVLAPTEYLTSGTILNVTSTAQNGSVTIYGEVSNNYGYDSGVPTHYIATTNVTQSGTVGSGKVLIRSLGLASKGFIVGTTSYVVGVYSSPTQPTYFVVNSSGVTVAKLAYSNGGGYLTTGLPEVSVSGSVAQFPYLYKDLLASVNKTVNSVVSAAIYSQTGINLATLTFESRGTASEIGGNLNLGAGFLWAYDGYSLTEQGFHLWPDSIEGTWSSTGGNIHAQPDGSTNTNAYSYQVTYEWSDNQGNINRSAPSIPIYITTIGTGSSGSILLDIPTLRVTAKTANPVKIVIYRWSVAQQTFYQVTSITNPLLNDTTVDYVTFTDTLPDSSIIGNSILYTTGGVIENIGAPATSLTALFNNRLFLVDSEDQNLLWFSKQVIEATPVEMSDLLTIYCAPTTSAQTSTGVITALSPMDDKLIIFKKNAIGFINGVGPDNTGANSGFSDFTLINSVVGCIDQASIVLMPEGLMFQSSKGIWLLGRDLSVQYIGAPVESLTTGATVLSAINVPMTTQVRFTLDTGITLMFDYYYQQWGSFINIPAVSSTVYQNLHTYLNNRGQVFQETPGVYLDNSSPVLMNFTTSWIHIAGVQGFERFYHCYLLGTTISPFKLNFQLAYDYNSSIEQNVIVTPPGYSANWGDDPLWGSSSPWGGSSDVFEVRVFPQRQKCESFQITITESFDSSIGLGAGAGLTLSGLNLVAGMKKGYRTGKASTSFG